MNWKEFFKPNAWKIVIFVIFLLILPLYGWQNWYCKPCFPPSECPPCGEYQFKLFGIPLLVIDSISPDVLGSWKLFGPSNLPVNVILIITIAYALSCLTMYIYNRIKK